MQGSPSGSPDHSPGPAAPPGSDATAAGVTASSVTASRSNPARPFAAAEGDDPADQAARLVVWQEQAEAEERAARKVAAELRQEVAEEMLT